MELDTVNKWRSVLEHSSDIITIVDDDSIITFESASTERILGYQAGDRVGDEAFEYIHPDDRDRVRATFHQGIRTPGAISDRIQYRFAHADGSWIWLESVGSNQIDSDLDGYVINSREITERKHYEQELKSLVDEHETLNRIIRHDIRNDLSVVLGWAQLLEEHVDDEGEEYLDYITESILQMVELTDVVKDYVRTLSEDESIEVVSTPLKSILEQEITVRRETYPSAMITIESEIPDVEVAGNELLSAVFRNLINNAIQHNDTAEPDVVVSVEEGEEYVVVSIADNGPGIPDDRKESIFGKGEAGLDDPDAGIGLYLVDTLLTQYGGDVHVEDNDPRGAIFTVELPLTN